jgi:flavin reductase (DIM6/NTAB) family NADH-FMN oxidoreductase RutF
MLARQALRPEFCTDSPMIANPEPFPFEQAEPTGDAQRDLRLALGRFPTGVAVLTALDADGLAIGLTVSSFNTVSLEPPLIVWSLQLTSRHLLTFDTTSTYAVNVLSADQIDVSNLFASSLERPFEAVAWAPGISGVPLLAGCSAWFEVDNFQKLDGGDHRLYLGKVLRFAADPSPPPLVFHDGDYRVLRND